MSESSTILSVRALSIGYGQKTLLEGLDFEIRRGEFVGILGSNGSGKTTLVRTIIGSLRAQGGKVEFGEGKGCRKAYVPQRDSLDDGFLFSAREVVEMGFYARCRPGAPLSREDREEIVAAMQRTGCASFASSSYRELSGGQKQRVLVARALVARPEILILDEPTSGVDAAAAKAIGDLLLELNQKDGVTILMVNHDLESMRRLSRRILWIENQKLLDGPTDSLLSKDRLESLLSLTFEREENA